MKSINCKILGIIVLCLGLYNACDIENNKNSFTWQGYWYCTEDPTKYGTFTATISIEGQNQDVYGGSGTLEGTITWTNADGLAVIDKDIAGEWYNDYKNNHILSFDFDLAIDEDSFTFSGYYGSSANNIDGDEFVIGSYHYGSESGQWRTSPSVYETKDPEILEAFTMVTGVNLTDLCWAGSYLYATAISDSDDLVFRINVQDGSYELVETSCPNPKGIAYGGNSFWLLSVESDVPKLYKYNSSWFPDQDYPIELVDHGMFGDIPTEIAWQGNSLVSFISGNSLIEDGIKSIDPVTGESTTIFSSGIHRAQGLAVTSNGFCTCYFAAGGEWCRLEKMNQSGIIEESYYLPVNETGPVASQEGNIWVGLNSNRVIYKIRISE